MRACVWRPTAQRSPTAIVSLAEGAPQARSSRAGSAGRPPNVCSGLDKLASTVRGVGTYVCRDLARRLLGTCLP
jgi:hypothetical protein